MMTLPCKYCGSANLYVEPKGTQLGLYCSDCGKWQKWLSKDEARVYKHNSQIEVPKQAQTQFDFSSDNDDFQNMKLRLQSFVDFLDKEIDKQLCRQPLSPEDAMIKCAVAQAYEKDKNALTNILNGKKWSYYDN